MVKKIIGFSLGSATLGAGIFTAVALNRSNVSKSTENTKIQEKVSEVKEPERLVKARQEVLQGNHKCVQKGDLEMCYPEDDTSKST